MSDQKQLEMGLLPVITLHKDSTLHKILWLFLSIIPIGACIIYTPYMFYKIGKYLIKNEPETFVLNVMCIGILAFVLILFYKNFGL